MPTPRDSFLKWKLTWIPVICIGVAMLLACGVLMYGEMQAAVAENLSTVARMAAALSRHALSEKNPPVATPLVEIFTAAPAIAAAAIYTEDGVVVASYLRDEKEPAVPPSPSNDGLQKAPLFLSLDIPLIISANCKIGAKIIFSSREYSRKMTREEASKIARIIARNSLTWPGKLARSERR